MPVGADIAVSGNEVEDDRGEAETEVRGNEVEDKTGAKTHFAPEGEEGSTQAKH